MYHARASRNKGSLTLISVQTKHHTFSAQSRFMRIKTSIPVYKALRRRFALVKCGKLGIIVSLKSELISLRKRPVKGAPIASTEVGNVSGRYLSALLTYSPVE
jgi:hypothetical protein